MMGPATKMFEAFFFICIENLKDNVRIRANIYISEKPIIQPTSFINYRPPNCPHLLIFCGHCLHLGRSSSSSSSSSAFCSLVTMEMPSKVPSSSRASTTTLPSFLRLEDTQASNQGILEEEQMLVGQHVKMSRCQHVMRTNVNMSVQHGERERKVSGCATYVPH